MLLRGGFPGTGPVAQPQVPPAGSDPPPSSSLGPAKIQIQIWTSQDQLAAAKLALARSQDTLAKAELTLVEAGTAVATVELALATAIWNSNSEFKFRALRFLDGQNAANGAATGAPTPRKHYGAATGSTPGFQHPTQKANCGAATGATAPTSHPLLACASNNTGHTALSDENSETSLQSGLTGAISPGAFLYPAMGPAPATNRAVHGLRDQLGSHLLANTKPIDVTRHTRHGRIEHSLDNVPNTHTHTHTPPQELELFSGVTTHTHTPTATYILPLAINDGDGGAGGGPEPDARQGDAMGNGTAGGGAVGTGPGTDVEKDRDKHGGDGHMLGVECEDGGPRLWARLGDGRGTFKSGGGGTGPGVVPGNGSAGDTRGEGGQGLPVGVQSGGGGLFGRRSRPRVGGGYAGRGVGPQRVTLHRRKRVMLLSRRGGARHRPYAASDFGLCSTGRHGSRTAGFKDGATVVDGGRDALYA